ncbi:hypothetical protein OA78_2397 [Latilactobacillus curvatus]|nr:hypothetical protein OA78_2397 [Latilactobacillus curvatus]
MSFNAHQLYTDIILQQNFLNNILEMLFFDD